MEETQKDVFKWANKRQYFATIIVNLIAFTQGCTSGWSSPALPQLASENTPLITGPPTIDEISWIGSITALGGIVGCVTYCYIISLLGAKRAALCLAIPYAIAFLFIYFGNTVGHILAARFLGGFANGGVDCTVTMFITEISNDDIRGRLASITPFTRNLGILFSFVIGGSVDYKSVPCIYIVVPISFVNAFALFPNSPQYYLQRAQIQKAENALKFYKGYKGNNNRQEDNAFHKELERLKSIANEQKSKKKTTIKDFRNRNALKGLGIGIVLMAFMPFTAINIFQSYAVTTFQKVGSSIDSFTSSIVLAVSLIFGSLTSTYLADILGRRKLNLISLFGAASGLFGTALYHYLSVNGYNLATYAWIPVTCLCFVIFISSAGINSLVTVCCIENLPSNIRTAGMAIICFCLNSSQFTSLKTYPKLLEFVDLYGVLMIYGVGCLVTLGFVFFVLKETAGHSLDDVDVNRVIEDTTSPNNIPNRI